MRGLLANAGFDGLPLKGIYFFPGEGDQRGLWTTHPLDERDTQWNSVPATRPWVLDRMIGTHANTVVASYWGEMPKWSPMTLNSTSWDGLLASVEGRQLLVMPALEGGSDPDPDVPQWQFQAEFPADPKTGALAPRLIDRIIDFAGYFRDKMNIWAQLYDRSGRPRYAINIIHATSDVMRPAADLDGEFASAFDQVAAEVRRICHFDVGFTLDVIPGRYSALPSSAGPKLAQADSVLAVHGFASEVWSNLVKNGPPCDNPDWQQCQPHDNNTDSLPAMADWKRSAVGDWAASGVPVILDVANGFDGRIVWKKLGTGFWGDNHDYTDDRWRNWMSQLKGPNIVGISFDTWNGYTEGYAAVPSTEHQGTVYNWLTDLLEPDPRDFSHMHYVNGVATHRVFGAICEKWIGLGGDRGGGGAPISDELPSARGRKQYFTGGRAIYFGPPGAHVVYGLIGQAYEAVGGDSSRLGLPIGDEMPDGAGRISPFEHGTITWSPGAASAQVNYF